MKKALVQFVVLIIALTMVPGARPGSEDPTVEVLHAKDQALLDAIAPGDRKVWDEVLAPEAVYVDENGVIMNRAEYLKQLAPCQRERRERCALRLIQPTLLEIWPA